MIGLSYRALIASMMASFGGLNPFRSSSSRSTKKEAKHTHNHTNTSRGAVGLRNRAYGVHWIKAGSLT